MLKHSFLFIITLLLPALGAAQSCFCGEEVTPTEYRVEAPSGLTVRSAPSRTAAKLGAIPKGTVICVCTRTEIYETIEDKEAYWLKISWSDQPAYVFGGFVSPLHYGDNNIQLFIPNSGIDSYWESARFDPTKKWTALTLQAKENTRYWYPGQFTSYGATPLLLNTQEPPPASDETEKGKRPLQMPVAPKAVFSGFTLNKQIINSLVFPEDMFPGKQLTYQLYDAQTGYHHNYEIFAKGNIVLNQPGYAGPIKSIDKYELWIWETNSTVDNPDYNNTTKQCIQVTAHLTSGEHTNSMEVPRIWFMGDLDGDNKLDIILSTGHSYQLFLSSKALPGFLLKFVAEFSDSCC